MALRAAGYPTPMYLEPCFVKLNEDGCQNPGADGYSFFTMIHNYGYEIQYAITTNVNDTFSAIKNRTFDVATIGNLLYDVYE